MSKGGRLSRLLPKLFKGDTKAKDQNGSSLKGPFCCVVFLDDTERQLPYKSNAKGQSLFNQICDMLDLLEKDYFGLRYVDDTGQTHWLDFQKSISPQLKGCHVPYKFYFGVKFYAADPGKLKEEITRYLFFLQVKRDILQGRLPLNYDEAAELCGYAVQSELGDYDSTIHTSGYVSEFSFVPNQTDELEQRIAGIHRRCVGATPLMAEQRFLEKVQWLEMYGVDLHPVQGENNIEYFLGLTPTGIVVYKQRSKVSTYFWTRVMKATRKAKRFILKVKDKNNDEHLYAFELSTKAACKHLCKCSIEHYAFFSGRSERMAAMENQRRPQPRVERTPSRRRTRRVHSASRLNADQLYHDQYLRSTRGTVTMMGQPEPVRAPRHRSLPELHGRQSPRSVKSAPWESNYDHGLYTSGHESPSAIGNNSRRDRGHTSLISGGSDSESGISQRKRYFPGRKGSDNESDGSASRRRRRERDSDSGSEVSYTTPNKGRKKRNPGAPQIKSFDSCLMYPFHDKENQNGSIPSLHSAPAGEVKQRRRRRTRGKSPGNNRGPPEELRQHIEDLIGRADIMGDPSFISVSCDDVYDLVDTEGMTEDQLRDINYTKVETKANLFRVKYSPKFRQKVWASRRKSFGDADRHSAPSRTNLSRQDSYHTDPAGTASRTNPNGGVDVLIGGQQGYNRSSHMVGSGREDEPQSNRASHWPVPSPRSERSGAGSMAGSGYNSASSSRAYHNPVYLGHRDAVAASGNVSDSNNNRKKDFVDGQFGFEEQAGYPTHQSPHQSGAARYHQRQRKTENSYNSQRNDLIHKTKHQDIYQNYDHYHQQSKSYPNPPSDNRVADYHSSNRHSQPTYSLYNQRFNSRSAHQSPYDADISRLDGSMMAADPTGSPRKLHPSADTSRFESSGYDGNIHRRSIGKANNMTSSSNNYDYNREHSNPRTSYPSGMQSSGPRHNNMSHSEADKGFAMSTPPRNASRPNNQQYSPPRSNNQPYNYRDYGGASPPSGHNNRSYTGPPGPGVSYGAGPQYSPSTVRGGHQVLSQTRYNSSMSQQQQRQQQSYDSYGAYSPHSVQRKSQPPPYPRSPGLSGQVGRYHDQQTPTQSRPSSGGSRHSQQRTTYRSDLVTQI